MPKKSPLTPLAALLPLLLVWSGCTTVSETGRTQVMLLSPAEEMQMGLQEFEQIRQSEKISTDPAVNAQVRRIGQRIAMAVGQELPGAQWEFVVFDAPQTVNAFALPGGKVGVYTGLIKLVASDDELAVVMGHEIAHVTSRHGGERVSQVMLVELGNVALAYGTQKSRQAALYQQLYGIGSTLTVLGFSRGQESEADAIGLRFAAKAGYDPRAAVSLWQKMQAGEGAAPPKWLSTHPPTADRIVNLRRLAETLMPVYEEARVRYQ